MNATGIHRRWLYLAAPWPALLLGALVMRRADLAATIWGQNLVVGSILTAVCAFLPVAVVPRREGAWWNAIILVVSVLLAATFLDRGYAGVHRWIQAGPLRVHVGAFCLPALALALGTNFHSPGSRNRRLPALLVAGITLLLLAAQPDATQATAFAGALLALLILHGEPVPVVILSALLITALVTWAWKHPDPLPPVPYVEGIVDLAAQNGALWQIGALVALALLPMPFLLAGRSGVRTALALGIYFGLCLLGSAVGTFPVPVMGFGLSPLVGYFTAVGWLAVHAGRSEATRT